MKIGLDYTYEYKKDNYIEAVKDNYSFEVRHSRFANFKIENESECNQFKKVVDKLLKMAKEDNAESVSCNISVDIECGYDEEGYVDYSCLFYTKVFIDCNWNAVYDKDSALIEKYKGDSKSESTVSFTQLQDFVAKLYDAAIDECEKRRETL